MMVVFAHYSHSAREEDARKLYDKYISPVIIMCKD